jgi:hypothetical protein
MSEENSEEPTVEDVMKELNAVKAKNEQLIGINKRISEKMEGMEEGKKQLIDKMKTAEEKRLIEAGDFDSLVQMKSQQALQAKDDMLRDFERKYEDTRRENERMQIGSMARQAAIMSGVRPEAQDEIELLARERFRMVDGKLQGFDQAGNELFTEKGEPMTIEGYIQSLAPTKSYLFNQKQGGGAMGGNGSAPSGIKRSDMTTEQKSAYVAKHGQDAFLNLPS